MFLKHNLNFALEILEMVYDAKVPTQRERRLFFVLENSHKYMLLLQQTMVIQSHKQLLFRILANNSRLTKRGDDKASLTVEEMHSQNKF